MMIPTSYGHAAVAGALAGGRYHNLTAAKGVCIRDIIAKQRVNVWEFYELFRVWNLTPR